jgi:hypothetical protein
LSGRCTQLKCADSTPRTTSVCESDIKQRIIILLQSDKHFNLVKESLQQEPNMKKYEEYHLTIDELLLYNNRLYVPDSTEMKHLIMDEFHRRPYVGHPGYQKMITTVRQLYYWPGMKKDIAEYIAKFLECQQVKVEHKHPDRIIATITNSRMEVGDYLHGLHHRISKNN